MQDHPLPQDITGYQFHIIGNMTLKQFAEVGAGVFVAFLVYTTNLHSFIKWPLIGLFVGIGVVAAFVPIEERPFDQWIGAFFKAIYKPTKFFWKRHPKIPECFLYQATTTTQTLQEVDLSPARRQRIKEFMFSLHQPLPLDPLEQYQNQRIDQIITTFSQINVSQVATKQQTTRPDLIVRVRDLKSKDGAKKKKTSLPTDQNKNMITQKSTDAAKIAQAISVPEVKSVKIAKDKSDEEKVVFSKVSQQTDQTYIEATPLVGEQIDQNRVQETSFNRELPFPSMPSLANTPVGMALNESGQMIPNTIIEIISENGAVVRAVKTNSLGQFFVTTPLKSGIYTVQAEKDGFSFAPIRLEAKGEIIAPIEIRGNILDTQQPTIATIN